jgi:hypothetical protein
MEFREEVEGRDNLGSINFKAMELMISPIE